jgi:hypothetical protein
VTYIRPPQITEREASHLWVDERRIDDARWEDCGPCTALEAVIASGHAAPATHFEEESLRLDAGYGPLGGTDVPALAAGIKKRYGITIAQVGSLSAFRTAMTPGHCGFAIVQPSRLPLAHVLRKYVGTDFVAFHFIYLANEGAAAPWMLDPAAPGASTGYVGTPLSWSDLATCYVGGAGVLPLAQEESMAIYEKTAQAGSFKIPAGTTAHALKLDPAAGFVRTGASATTGSGRYDAVLHRIVGDQPPTAVIHVVSGLWAGFYVNTGEVDETADPAAPAFTKADVDAARAAGYAAAKTKAATAVSAI